MNKTPDNWQAGGVLGGRGSAHFHLKTSFDAKAFAILQARAALHGFAFHAVDADDQQVFTVSHWNLSRLFRDAAAVELFLSQIGAQ